MSDQLTHTNGPISTNRIMRFPSLEKTFLSLFVCTGQFWNIPVSIKPFTGENVFGQRAVDTYIVNITTISQQRLYVGVLGHLTWEVEEGPCLYVGDSQSDSTYEFADPNDRVIEGLYTDYIVSGSFNDDFKFGLFDEEKCEND